MEKELEDLGLTDSEVKVYLNLLQIGSNTSGAIIQKTGLQSSTVYHALDFLIKKGLVGFITKNNKKYFEVTRPDFLLELVHSKKQALLQQENAIKEIIPTLEAMQKHQPRKLEASIFEGDKGIKSAFNDILKSLDDGDEYYVFGARGGLPLEWTQNFFRQFNKKKALKKIKTKIIFNADVRETTGKDEESLPLTTVKYLDQTTPAAINIYKDKVIIALWIENPTAFMIKNKAVAESYKQYFQALWKTAK
ncbi:MAG: helix-turn-helix domain-containing protein [archaeon]|jgi:sugar-specific transcriptional regulator TrmB